MYNIQLNRNPPKYKQEVPIDTNENTILKFNFFYNANMNKVMVLAGLQLYFNNTFTSNHNTVNLNVLKYAKFIGIFNSFFILASKYK